MSSSCRRLPSPRRCRSRCPEDLLESAAQLSLTGEQRQTHRSRSRAEQERQLGQPERRHELPQALELGVLGLDPPGLGQRRSQGRFGGPAGAGPPPDLVDPAQLRRREALRVEPVDDDRVEGEPGLARSVGSSAADSLTAISSGGGDDCGPGEALVGDRVARSAAPGCASGPTRAIWRRCAATAGSRSRGRSPARRRSPGRRSAPAL